MQTVHKLVFIISVIFLILISTPGQGYAQWPPFRFELIPSYENHRLTYYVLFNDRIDWTMTNVTIKIPLPEGTRFLETKTIPTITASFDGADITFFIPTLNRQIAKGDALFIVEIVDPATHLLSTHAWVSWEGEEPGNFLTEDVKIDISKQPLDWAPPATPRLRLEANATTTPDSVTYFFHPRNMGNYRMWDVKINVPIPSGTTLIAAEALHPFTASFDGREVSFTAIELERRAIVSPLTIKLATENVTTPVIKTHAWATWKNSGRSVTRSAPLQEETLTPELIVEPGAPQQIWFDTGVGDVPFANYDITSIALQEMALPQDEAALKVTVRTAGDLGPVGDPIEFNFYINDDCQLNTGAGGNGAGAEYWIRYQHTRGLGSFRHWDSEKHDWNTRHGTQFSQITDNRTISLWIPYRRLINGQQFCWKVAAKNNLDIFIFPLPREVFPYRSRDYLQYQSTGAATEVKVEEAQLLPAQASRSKGSFIEAGDPWRYLPGWTEPPPGWKLIDFDDSNWYVGPTAIGYGSGKVATDLNLITPPTGAEGSPVLVQRIDKQSGMVVVVLSSGHDSSSFFMRHIFEITGNPALITKLTLNLSHEGGFIAYLNGQEIGRSGLGQAGKLIFYDALAEDQDDQASKKAIDLTPYIPILIQGKNILAIQVHKSVNSSNLAMNPALEWVSDPKDLKQDTGDGVAPVSNPAPAAFSPSPSPISGKLAVPIDNGRATYDIHIFSMPDGREIVQIPNARQPSFRFDGQRLLVNREGGGTENLFEYNMADGAEQQVSDAPRDSHPFYDRWGNRVVYGNSELSVGQGPGARQPFIFVQCSLLPPHQEADARCRDIAGQGVLVPAGQTGDIQGTHPIWTIDDMIVYSGCNTWAGSRLCGIYSVPSGSTKRLSDGFIPGQLTRDSSDIPTDTKGNLITFMSRRDGDWESYIMDLNGAKVNNLSNSSASHDGLPAISPDGAWVAFISDRTGHWAIWVVPAAGGSAQKLFDLPAIQPWGDGDRTWTNERISWGP